jgi:hypothetical protein
VTILRSVVCTVGAAIVFLLVGSPAATAATVPSAQLSGLHVAQPSTVCGFSQHALDRMASRGISPLDVRMTVALGADSAFRNSHDNWQYERSGLIVTMTDAGCVVTAMYR